ncbi:hypothetical protein GC194_11735 [bacterium]|nr:hypothetical protein [bacterium]
MLVRSIKRTWGLKLKVLIKMIAGLCLVFFGEELALYVYKYYYKNSNLAILGILAVVILMFGSTFISWPIIRWSSKIDKRVKKWNKPAKVIAYTSILVIFFIPHMASIVLFYKNTDEYHIKQLDAYGITQMVYIAGKIEGENSRHDLLFEYNHDGEIFNGMLNRWKFQVGDSALIIYSSENPSELEWYQKYIENKDKNQHKGLIPFWRVSSVH